jgi:hypothetical protein
VKNKDLTELEKLTGITAEEASMGLPGALPPEQRLCQMKGLILDATVSAMRSLEAEGGSGSCVVPLACHDARLIQAQLSKDGIVQVRLTCDFVAGDYVAIRESQIVSFVEVLALHDALMFQRENLSLIDPRKVEIVLGVAVK